MHENHFLSVIHAGLTVTISVDYTPPPGANLGPNEYRAGSGPVSVTCTAQGGSGPTSYQWSSTCQPGCLFTSSTENQITQNFIRTPFLQGTHTCSVTRGSTTRSETIVFNVVGKWISTIVIIRGATGALSLGMFQTRGSFFQIWLLETW